MQDIKINQKYNSDSHLEEIECVVPKDDFEKNFEKALENIRKATTIPGFRKGNAPKGEILKKKYNDVSNTAINLSIDDAIKSMGDVEPKPFEPLNLVSVNVDEEQNLVLKFTYIPFPEITLGDVEKIKVKEKAPKETTEEEVNNELKNIWFYYAGKNSKDLKKEDFSEEKINEDFFNNTDIKKDNPNLKSLNDLKEYLKNYISETYKRDASVTWEKEVMDKLIDISEFERLEPIINKELEKRVQDYKSKFTNIGMNADEYMSKNNISEEDLKKDWTEQVEKDVKLELLLQKYGSENKIEPTEEEINANLESLDPATKTTYGGDTNYLKSLIRYYYINQKSYIDILEKVKSKSGDDSSKSK